jgi:2-polyprenyl-3-methyl-5-hydroxy-6-metoxy-1,4-benzoquinol methylase
MLHDRNRFADFLGDGKYVALKNHLYNYRLRKRAIRKCLQRDPSALILEIGSGISPMVNMRKGTIYSDLSYEAVKLLKQDQGEGYYVVANGVQLPFKSNRFSAIICSEVLEHIKEDRSVLEEIARTIKKPEGSVILTVPHRKGYFAIDDRFVNHRRRYELAEIRQLLTACHFKPVLIRKVLGPVEKMTIMLVIFVLTRIRLQKTGQTVARKSSYPELRPVAGKIFAWINLAYMGFAWLDAVVMPRPLATVILVKAVPSNLA